MWKEAQKLPKNKKNDSQQNKIKFPVEGNLFRSKSGMVYISHKSKNGNAVGYVLFELNWYGPMSWNEFGSVIGPGSRFNIDGFCASNCYAQKHKNPESIKAEAKPYHELLKLLRSRKS